MKQHFSEKIISALALPQENVSEFLLAGAGQSDSEINRRFIQWITKHIEFASVTDSGTLDDLDVLTFLEANEVDIPGRGIRLEILGQIRHIDFYRALPTHTVAEVERIFQTHPQYRRFCYAAISQLDIPASHVRIACLHLLEYPDPNKFAIRGLTRIFTGDTNLIERYQAAQLLRLICIGTDFRIFPTKSIVLASRFLVVNTRKTSLPCRGTTNLVRTRPICAT